MTSRTWGRKKVRGRVLLHPSLNFWPAWHLTTCLFISLQRGSLISGRRSTFWTKMRRMRRRTWPSRWLRWRPAAKCCWTAWSIKWSQCPALLSTAPHPRATTSHHRATVAAQGNNLCSAVAQHRMFLFSFLQLTVLLVCVDPPLLTVRETLRGIQWRTASGWIRGPTPWRGNDNAQHHIF